MNKLFQIVLVLGFISSCQKKNIPVPEAERPSDESKQCKLGYDQSQTKISWEAYKTEKKAPVKGHFEKFTITPGGSNSTDFAGILPNSSFEIEASSVSTGNKSRDGKIAKFFFSTMIGGEKIRGSIKSIDEEKKHLNISLNLNGTERDVVLVYQVQGKTMRAEATIDVLNFNMNSQLAALGKACEVLHEGKTWPTVRIILETQFALNC